MVGSWFRRIEECVLCFAANLFPRGQWPCGFDANEENTMKLRMKEQISIRIVALLGLAFLVFLAPRVDAVVVDIPDEALEAYLRERLGIGASDPITDTALAGLRGIDARNRGITELRGLEYCVNLDGLMIGQNNISDLRPLSGLTKLDELLLFDNNISDISPLARLTKLTQLTIYQNNITDIRALSGLTSLQSLDLEFNNISNINALSGLINLRYIVLGWNYITDIQPLVDNPGLNAATVELEGNPLKNKAINIDIPILMSSSL